MADLFGSELRRPPGGPRDWYRIQAKAGQKKAEVWIYDEISPWGTSAKDFAAELRAIAAEEITLHLNTPGGDAFEGLAIYNALRDHPATVTVLVDGLAASAGSFIAQAGDVVRMNRGAQMMIHDAAGVVIGNASDMQSFADVLNRTSDSIAGIYASRVGGTVAEWRTAMAAESWYTAAEAVDVGLADEMVDAEPPDASVRNAWDLTVFAYAGRDKAPVPVLNRRPSPPTRREPPQAPVSTGAFSCPKEGAGMNLAKYREALAGIPDDASEDQVNAALTAVGLSTTAPPVVASAVQPPLPGLAPEPPATPEPKRELVNAAGLMQLDPSMYEQLIERTKRLEAKVAKHDRDERDQVLTQAVVDGKFAPFRKEHWARLWDADPEGTRQVIDSLSRNIIPVMASGYNGDDADIDAEYASLFPPTGKGV